MFPQVFLASSLGINSQELLGFCNFPYVHFLVYIYGLFGMRFEKDLCNVATVDCH